MSRHILQARETVAIRAWTKGGKVQYLSMISRSVGKASETAPHRAAGDCDMCSYEFQWSKWYSRRCSTISFGGADSLGTGALRSYCDFDRVIHDGMPVSAFRHAVESLGPPEKNYRRRNRDISNDAWKSEAERETRIRRLGARRLALLSHRARQDRARNDEGGRLLVTETEHGAWRIDSAATAPPRLELAKSRPSSDERFSAASASYRIAYRMFAENLSAERVHSCTQGVGLAVKHGWCIPRLRFRSEGR